MPRSPLFAVGSARHASRVADPARMLHFIYAGRLVVCLAVFGSALVAEGLWGGVSGPTRTIALGGLALAGLATPLAYWWSHVRREEAGSNFLYGQAVLDILLVTGIVHITGGVQSLFPPLFYITLASGYALLLPFASAVLVALATGVAYLAEVSLAYPGQLGLAVLLQIAILTVVASISSVIGARLRQVRGEVRRLEGDLHRLRLGTTDVLRTIDSGVVTVDGEGRLAYMNPAAERLLGMGADRRLGEPLLPELERRAPELAAAVRESLRGGADVGSRETWVRREDGEVVPLAVSTAHMDRPRAEPSVTLALQDLRPVRRLEDLRLRAERLEAVAELSASLAHEIRNPLASIRSAVEQLGERKVAGEEDRGLVRLVLRESDRLATLLEEFGDFARVGVAERRPVDLREVSEEAIATVRQHPDAPSGTRLELTIEEEPEDLWGDRELLHRTLVNLVLNAVQAAARETTPEVTVAVDALEPASLPGEAGLGTPVRIRVSDNGPGFPEGAAGRIFDPFFTTRDEGSGLGLSIAHRAVHAHGGALLATSARDGGACMVVVLPRRGEERADVEATAAREDAASRAAGAPDRTAGAERASPASALAGEEET